MRSDGIKRRGRIRAAGAHGAAAALLLAAAAAAQQVQPPEPPDAAARRDLRGTREAEGVRERAREREPFEGPRVDYADVLRDPDNVELNYRFAQTQVRDGDVRGAASTLERILLANPGLAQVRLLYAIVLFRLDSLNDAEREFRLLEGLALPDEVRREVERYRRELDRRRARTRYVANLSLGWQYDSNRDAAPSGGQRLFVDVPATAPPGKSDTALLAMGSLRMTHDLGTPEGHEFFAIGTGYANWQNQLTQFDLLAGGVETGFTLRGDEADLMPSVLAGYAALDRSRLVCFVGARLRVERQQGEDLLLHADGMFQYQDYDNVNRTQDGVAVAPTASQLTGGRFDGELGATWTVDPEQRLTAAYVFTSKHAETPFNGYDGSTFLLRYTRLLGAGQSLIGQAAYEIDAYDGPDPFISATTRRDRILRLRLAYGAPLTTLAAALAPSPSPPVDWLAGLTLLVAGEYLNSDSNIENYTYDNWRGQILLTKTWEF